MSFYQKQELKSVVCDTFMDLFRFSWTLLLPRPQLFAQPQLPQQTTMWAHANQLPKADWLHALSLWFLLPFLDLGEIPYYRVWLPKQLSVGFHDATRTAGE